MSTMRTEPIAKPPVNPIKRIQEDILAFLEKRRGEPFSSYQIVEGLRKQGALYAIEYVQNGRHVGGPADILSQY